MSYFQSIDYLVSAVLNEDRGDRFFAAFVGKMIFYKIKKHQL